MDEVSLTFVNASDTKNEVTRALMRSMSEREISSEFMHNGSRVI